MQNLNEEDKPEEIVSKYRRIKTQRWHWNIDGFFEMEMLYDEITESNDILKKLRNR